MAWPAITKWSGGMFQAQLTNALNAIDTGGGATAWGGISGTLSAQTDLQTALNGKQAAGSYATATQGAKADTAVQPAALAAYQPIIAAGSGTLTLPTARYEHEETITATGVIAGSRVDVYLAAATDDDENTAEMLDIAAMSATAGTGQITVNMAFLAPVSGPILINWSAI